jgi:hypothetical protein
MTLYICSAARMCFPNAGLNSDECSCRHTHDPEHVQRVYHSRRPCYENRPCDFRYYENSQRLYGSAICIEYEGPETIKSLPTNLKELDEWWLKHDDAER